MPELTAPMVYKNDERQIVYGPVLIPDEPDTDGDVVTASKIEEVAHKFVEDYGNIDLMHSLNNVGHLVESYILPMDLRVGIGNTVPKGSWMMGVRVTCEDTWQAVKEGGLGGFSIMALQKAAVKSAEKSSSKRVTLADLGDDWIVNAVSLVDEPAVPKAKWVAIKSKGEVEVDSAVKRAINGSLEHRQSLVERELSKQFKDFDGFPIVHSTMMDSVIFRLVSENDDEKTYMVDYSIDDGGAVDFSNEPQEVAIQHSIVSVDNMLVDSFKSEDQPKSNEGVFSRFMKGLGFGAKEQEGGVNMGLSKEEVLSIIEEQVTPLNETIKSLTEAIDSQVEEAEEVEEVEEVEKSKDSEGEEEEYKQKYEQALKELDKLKKTPFSNRLAGQDGSEKSKEEDEGKPSRNAFGFKNNTGDDK